MKIAAIYARQSLDRGESVDHQVQMIKEFNKHTNKNETDASKKIIIKDEFVFVDKGESGFKKSLLQRDEMRKLLELVDNGIIQVIYFKGISRFARSAEESMRTARKLKDKNIRVISIEESFDSDVSDPIMFQFYSIMAEQESRKTSIRVSLGNKQKARNGLYAGSITPYGYTKVKDIRNENLKKEVLLKGKHEHSLWPDHTEAEIVKKIFDKAYSEGAGRKKIASYLNQRGIKTRSGHLFTEARVKQILSNEVYTGTIVYGKTKYEYIEDETKNKKIQKEIQVPKEEWVISENAHPPIVERSVFMDVQKIISKRTGSSKGKRFNNARHPLTGILKCGKCGAPMICQKRSNIRKKDGAKLEYRYYVCSTYHSKGRHVCEQANINADSLEEYVHHALSKEIIKLKNEGYLENLNTYNQNDEINKEISIVEDSIRKNIIKSENLLENIDLYDKETFKTLNNKIREELSSLRNSKEKLLEQLTFSDLDNHKEEIKNLLNDFLDLNLNDIEQSRKTFHSLINQIIVEDNKIQIDAKFNLLSKD